MTWEDKVESIGKAIGAIQSGRAGQNTSKQWKDKWNSLMQNISDFADKANREAEDYYGGFESESESITQPTNAVSPWTNDEAKAPWN